MAAGSRTTLWFLIKGYAIVADNNLLTKRRIDVQIAIEDTRFYQILNTGYKRPDNANFLCD